MENKEIKMGKRKNICLMLQGMNSIINGKWLSWFETTIEISLVILVKLSNYILIAHPGIKKLIKKIAYLIFY